jgi:hypothetical protein
VKTLISILVVCAVGVGHAGAQSDRRLLPADEAVERPDFFSFRARLQTAIARRDAAFVVAIVDPGIRNSFGPDQGMRTFVDTWRPNEPDSRLWAELGGVLALGGRFDASGSFVAPYVYAGWPNDLDSFEHVAIVGSDVHVRAAPRPDAASLRRVTFAVLRRAPTTKPDPDWIAVQLPRGATGYVAVQLVRSPVGYRAFFRFARGRWWLTAFVAGD